MSTPTNNKGIFQCSNMHQSTLNAIASPMQSSSIVTDVVNNFLIGDVYISVRNDIWVAPDLSKPYLYGHFLNHSSQPNCVVDRLSGIITTVYKITKGAELTIDYGSDYDWSLNTTSHM